LSSACDRYADAVEEAKHKLEETAAEIVAAVAAGAAATVFTLGISDAVGGAAVAALSATALGTVEVLGTTVAEIVGGMTMGAVFGAMDSVLETNFGNAAKTALGDKLPSAQAEIAGLVASTAIGGLTGVGKPLVVGTAKAAGAAAAVKVPTGVSELIPQLSAILGRMPDALETPAGEALNTMANQQAAGHAVHGAFGRKTDAPTLPQLSGELLNAKIEAAGSPEDRKHR
jgi:hypothetical protein